MMNVKVIAGVTIVGVAAVGTAVVIKKKQDSKKSPMSVEDMVQSCIVNAHCNIRKNSTGVPLNFNGFSLTL